MFWIYRDDFAAADEIDYGSFTRIKRCRQNAGSCADCISRSRRRRRPKLARGSIFDDAVNIRCGSPDYGPP
jgi:hypothetical protein